MTIGLGLTAARGDESNVAGEPPSAAPTAQQTKRTGQRVADRSTVEWTEKC